jgi:hypothetical protein
MTISLAFAFAMYRNSENHTPVIIASLHIGVSVVSSRIAMSPKTICSASMHVEINAMRHAKAKLYRVAKVLQSNSLRSEAWC